MLFIRNFNSRLFFCVVILQFIGVLVVVLLLVIWEVLCYGVCCWVYQEFVDLEWFGFYVIVFYDEFNLVICFLVWK